MQKIKHLLTIALTMLASFCFSAYAVEIEIGDRSLNVNIPAGYVELTPAMSPYYETMRAYIAPTNTRYFTLIPTDDADALLRGEVVNLERYINVESQESLDNVSVSAEMYDSFRDVLRTQMDAIVEEVNKMLPGIVDRGNARVSEAFDLDVAVTPGNMVPLPIHVDSANAMVYSMYMKLSTSVDGEVTYGGVVSATASTLHVRDKVLFIYVYGSETDLEWSREFSSRWTEQIFALNPISMAEQSAVAQSGSSGIWDGVLKKAAIGALIGGLLGGFGFLIGRRKKE